MKRLILYISLFLSFFIITAFNIENAIIPKNEILSGGPPKDGIPAILKPEFIKPAEAGYLNPDDPVIGIEIAGESKVYPIKILNWHEVVNDTVGGVPITVTF